MEEILLLNKFFPIVDMCLSCEVVKQQNSVGGRNATGFLALSQLRQSADGNNALTNVNT